MKITLATLPGASAQAVADQIVQHLLTQNARSARLMKGEILICAYRSTEGLACAAGCMMSSEEHSGDMEDKPWNALADDGEVPATHSDLITEFQIVHDCNEVEEWPDALRAVCGKHMLQYNPPLPVSVTA